MSKSVTLSLLLWILPLWLFAGAPTDYPYYQKKLHELKQMKQTDLLFLGDSLTDYHNWSRFGKHFNAGIAGDTTDGLLYRMEYILDKKPETIVLMIGINDLLQGINLEQIEQNYLKILDSLEKTKRLIILSTLPVIDDIQTREINDKVTALNIFLKIEAKKRGAEYVDLYSHFTDSKKGLIKKYTIDGVHLNDSGYKLWENILSLKI